MAKRHGRPPGSHTSAAFLVLAFLAFTGPRPACAQPFSDPGTGIGGSANAIVAPEGWSDALFPSLAVRFRLTGNLGVELAAGFFSSTLEENGAEALRANVFPLTGSVLLYFFPNHRIQPTLILGLSYHQLRLSGSPDVLEGNSIEHQLGLHAGAGIQARIAKNLSLFADARFLAVSIDAADNTPFEWTSHWTAGAGLLFHVR